MSTGITNKTLKNIFIFLIPFLSVSYLIINSSQFKGLSHKIKTNLLPRNLGQTAQKSTKICEKISSKLDAYFKTGDKSELGLEEDNTEEYGQYYIKALINIVKHYYAKKKDKQNSSTRILDDDDGTAGYMKNLFKYAYHILPLLIVFGIGILSLIGWLVCCCCTCYKCKCCVCKVPKCKTPSTVLAIIFYIIVALISFYALTEQNKIFSGLADTECSVLKFTDGILYGETNKFPPYWAGIDNIVTILEKFRDETINLQISTPVSSIEGMKTDSNGLQQTFENNLDSKTGLIDSNDYTKSYNGKNYKLDIAEQFGRAENSVKELWKKEYQTISTNANTNMGTIKSHLLDINRGNFNADFTNGVTKIKELKNEFLSLKELIADEIIEKADKIDKTGKIVYTLFFIFLMVLCAAIVVFMLLLCCCSGELCTNLSCCQCFCKFFLHFFWNLMAFIMFVLFMGGSIFTISGTTGGDLVKVVSYLISKDNLEPDKDTIILGNVKQYLNKCFNYDGKILNELGLVETDIDKYEDLKKAKLSLEELKSQFEDIKFKFVYSEYKDELNQRINYESEELKLIASDNTEPIEFKKLIDEYNTYATSNNIKERWEIGSTSNAGCSSANPDETHSSDTVVYNPKNCYPTVKSYSTYLTEAKNKLEAISQLIEKAGDNTDNNSIKKIIEGLCHDYDVFLIKEIETLGTYIDKIKTITTDIVEDYTSEDGELFSFMNCAFIKDNVEVILFYLKNSFKNDMYEVGVYLLIAAFSMPFGISFTILLIMISNDEIATNLKKEEEIKKRKSQTNININQVQEVKIDNNENNGASTEKRGLNQNS